MNGKNLIIKNNIAVNIIKGIYKFRDISNRNTNKKNQTFLHFCCNKGCSTSLLGNWFWGCAVVDHKVVSPYTYSQCRLPITHICLGQVLNI